MIDRSTFLALGRSPRLRRFGKRALAFGLLYGALGFLVLPALLKPWLAEGLQSALRRTVTLEKVAIDPFALSLRVDGLTVRERGGGEVVAGVDRLDLNFELPSLWRGGPVLSQLRIERPRLKIVRLEDRRYNHSDLIDEFMARPASPTPLFSLSNIELRGGILEFDDRVLDERHRVDEIELALPFLSSLPHYATSLVVPAFSARVDGAAFAVQARGKPFADDRESELTLTVDSLPLAAYLDYLPLPPALKIDSGMLGGEFKAGFRQEKGKASALLLSGKLRLDNLRASRVDGAPWLALRHGEVDVAVLDFSRRKLAVERIALDSPEIEARIDRSGAVDWQALLPAASAEPGFAWSLGEASVSNGALRWLDDSRGKAERGSVEELALRLWKLDGAPQAAPGGFELAGRARIGDWLEVDSFAGRAGSLSVAGREATVGELALRGVRGTLYRSREGVFERFAAPAAGAFEASQAAADRPGGTPWKLAAGRVRGEEIGLRLVDRSFDPAAIQNVRNLAFDVENLSFAPGAPAKVAGRFAFNRAGAGALTGTLQWSPLSAALSLDLEGIELPPLQPYIGQRFNAAVARGSFALHGDLRLARAGEGDTGEVTGDFRGRATVSGFQALEGRPEGRPASELLKWKSLHFGDIDLQLPPTGPVALSIGEVALSDFFSRVVLDPEGRLNLASLLRAAGPAGDGGPDAPPVQLRVGKMTLQGGNVQFSDLFVKPNYSVGMRRIGGSLSGLSSEAGSLATLDLRGDYDDGAPLAIGGRLNPLAAQPYLDLRAEIRGVEMTPLSPYAGKYAGYAIEQGKLSLFAQYRLENRQLSAENRIFLDQLSFGEPVASPDATRLPVMLLVALLKNGRGEIEVDLPISGSLDDPEFDVGELLARVLGNFLVKAAASPFALLGALFGDGEELSFVEFDEGGHALNEAAQKRLATLARALADRPAVRLGIGGRADIERDRAGLQRALLDAVLNKLKHDEAARRGGAPEASEAPGGEPREHREYADLLARAYRAGDFPKPRNLLGFVKELPVGEMEKLMLSHLPVGEDDLRALAERRAHAVRDWLRANSAVSAQRVFLQPVRLEGRDRPPEGGRTQPASRVDFSLK